MYPSVLGELSEVLHEQRQIKDEVEIDAMRRAGELSGQAFAEVMKATQPGLNESDIAAHMEYHFKRRGANGPATVRSLRAAATLVCCIMFPTTKP